MPNLVCLTGIAAPLDRNGRRTGHKVFFNYSGFVIAVIDFKLRTAAADGGIEYVTDHQALEVLNIPQPIVGGKSMLSAMDLKINTTTPMLLNGESATSLARHRLPGGPPTPMALQSGSWKCCPHSRP